MPSHQVCFYSGRHWTPGQEDRLKYLTKKLTEIFATNQGITLLNLAELDPDTLGQLLLLHEAESPGAIQRILSTIFLNFAPIRQALGEAVEETKIKLTAPPTPEVTEIFLPETEEVIRARLAKKGLVSWG